MYTSERRSKYSSQRPRTRAPPAGSSVSGTSTSTLQDKHNVHFAAAPSLAPSDSISRAPRSSRHDTSASTSRRYNNATRVTRYDYSGEVKQSRSRTSGASSQTGSGSGAPLTENNLERLNQSDAPSVSSASRREPRSRTRETYRQVDESRYEQKSKRTYATQARQTGSTTGASRQDDTSPQAGASIEITSSAWERRIHVVTRRWPDGREETEREVMVVRPTAA
ncbi:hypothetical protein BDY17DRAFT_157876 [Neohortaea acidophila]|uniref:Uncharacterized protein n=1 Tax=Neohortaea acidophila TaxID=245834 RepID=A0A6A6PRK3_9PEZI|nr:uncharacterized protein BDY17DRAFT_157876 [Neohortaea acidophila]KAF2482301.1 hypothetical protein BDY17DRAFT_157876 [Neohortaea acidophila]